jgi:uncharacterized membrane protein
MFEIQLRVAFWINTIVVLPTWVTLTVIYYIVCVKDKITKGSVRTGFGSLHDFSEYTNDNSRLAGAILWIVAMIIALSCLS